MYMYLHLHMHMHMHMHNVKFRISDPEHGPVPQGLL